MKTALIMASVLATSLITSSAFANEYRFRCQAETAVSFEPTFTLMVGAQNYIIDGSGSSVSIQSLKLNQEPINPYEQPSASQITFAIPAWNGNDAATFLLVPRPMSSQFVAQMTEDEEGGAPFNSGTDDTRYLCTLN
jgi:hypothetical protein